MARFVTRRGSRFVFTILALAVGCARPAARLEPAETFHWVTQPIAFSPPAGNWRREGDNGGGLLGVRFILTGGGGQCISVYAHRMLAERSRREKIARLIVRRDSLSRHEQFHELSLARSRSDDAVSEREAGMARDVNAAIDRAMSDVAADQPGFVAADLDAALRAADAYTPTLEELLPRIRLRPDTMQEPDRWRIGYEHDTTLAGQRAFASEDTLITPERPLLYHELLWVVNGCAFKAVYQGTEKNLGTFERMVDSIRFPEQADDVTK